MFLWKPTILNLLNLERNPSLDSSIGMNEWMNESLFLFSMVTIVNEKTYLFMIK